MPTAEHRRLYEDRHKLKHWRKWGAYVSDRQWGTVREDYSPDGAAWTYFPHDHARSRAYRWGEDGIGGISDNHQLRCLSLAMWNGRDPILKERLFGLTGVEGNHGEDVKELYYYLDATPTHSYLKMLYKYPQRAFPYEQLVAENRRRGRNQGEYELIDTGLFDDDRYFDVFIEYAKADARDLLMRVTVHNRGPDAAPIHLLPHFWLRNTWTWTGAHDRPVIRQTGPHTLTASFPDHLHRDYLLSFEGDGRPLFTENDTNTLRLYGFGDSRGRKDAFHEYLIHGRHDVVNPDPAGTKSAVLYRFDVPAGGSVSLRLRLAEKPAARPDPFADFDAVFAARRREADEFYAHIQRDLTDPDARLVQRQAFAGMVWSQQYYHIDIRRWLHGDPATVPPPESRKAGRNADWQHLNTDDILSMPDKWEYPWFAAWDLAFHCIPLAMIDPEFAKVQLIRLTREWYMHPNGQLPAYEWQFGDVNPPVHAWATWRVFEIDRDARRQSGQAAASYPGDHGFLERVFHKLLLNFTWWVNRKDAEGRNIFQGGFLGLDNIGVFDRSAPLPTGGFISQADGTSWMAMYSLNLMRIALELATVNPIYQDIASKFFEHFLYIAAAMTNIGGDGIDLWDKEDEFFYDVLCLPDKHRVPLKVRSMVGLIPLFAVEVLSDDLLEHLPEFSERLKWFMSYRPDLASLVSRWHEHGRGETHLLSLLRGHRMKCLLKRMLDESEFLSDYGVRALSRYHKDHPYVFRADGGNEMHVTYQPAESDTCLFGGNSNWRGPIWMPVNYLLIESLRRFHSYYGDDFLVEYPTGSGRKLSINQIADELTRRLCRLVLRDASGRRPVFGDCQKQQTDPHFRDYVPFYEYFHGDTGRGVGASHQTGWTGLLAHLLATLG